MTQTREQILKRVTTVILDQLGVDEDEVTPEADIVADLGADSLYVIEIIMALEEEFDIEIPDDDAGPWLNALTVSALVDYVTGKIG